MKKSIRDIDVRGKKVIVRCDLNVPVKDGIIQDDTRIRASLKTIKYIIDNGGSVIVLSHLGKIKCEEDIERNSLRPVAIRLGELLNKKIIYVKGTRDEEVTALANTLRVGEVMVLENTRYEDLDGNKESGCDMELAKYWASLGDIFVNDAYGTCHRSHASNVGISKYLPSALGFLVSDEISKLDGILNEDSHPFVVIMGGAKVSDKIKVIENLVNICDKLLIGGGMAYTFIKALGYDVGNSLVDYDSIDFCKDVLDKYRGKIELPIDSIVTKDIDSDDYIEVSIDKIPNDMMGVDIGSKTIDKYKNILKDSKRVIINGPMGIFEKEVYSVGTKSIYDYIVDNNIKTLVGGGDSASSVNKLSNPSKFYHISTGGGATLEYLEGKELPGISVIDDEE